MSLNTPVTKTTNAQPEEEVNIRAIIEKYFYYWKWFVLSIVTALLIAFLYLRYTTKNYVINAQILLNEKSSASPELAALSDAAASFTGEGSNAVVNDQIKILESRRLIYKTVNTKKLNIHFFIEGKVKKQEVLAASSPVNIAFAQDSMYTSDKFKGALQIESLSTTQFQVIESDFIQPGTYTYNSNVNSELGVVQLMNNQKDKNQKFVSSIELQPIMNAVLNIQKKLTVSPDADKNSMIINLSMIDNIKERGVLVINSLINNYNHEEIGRAHV